MNKSNAITSKKYFSFSHFFQKTFASKLFIKLTESIIDKRIIFILILQFEYANRNLEDISKAAPYLSNLGDFYNYICFKENKINIPKILNEITWLLFYKYYKALSIIKRPNEFNQNFYVIMTGKVDKLSLVYKKICLTFEEYLIFLLKMKIINEKGIINKCALLNSKLLDKRINLNYENLKPFFEQYKHKYNYDKLHKIAAKELRSEGFFFDHDRNTINISSIDAYYKIGRLKYNIVKNSESNEAKLMFYIPHYEKIATLEKGCIIGDLTNNFNEENYAYVTRNSCDIIYIEKDDTSIETKIYDIFNRKKREIFSEIKNNFSLFQKINDYIFFNQYAPYMIYKKYKKGDKIFLQNSNYDGIFLIVEGDIQISVNLFINEIPQFLLDLKCSLNQFQDYAYNFRIEDIFDYDEELKNNYANNPLISSKDYMNIYCKPQEIVLTTMKKNEILGLNEFYNYKTKLFNFTAECASDYALLYFLPYKYSFTLLNVQLKDSVTNYIESRINYFIGKINKFKSDFLNKSYNSIKFLKGIKFQKEMSRIKSRKEISILSKKSINLNDIIKEDNNLSNIKKCKSKDKNKTCINFIRNSKFFNNNIINDNEINNVKNMNSKISDTSMKYISFEKNKSKSHSQKIKHYILGKSSYKISKNSLKNLNLNKSNHLPFFIGDFELINKGMKNKDIKDDISKRYNSLNNKNDSYLNTLKNLNLKSIKRIKANNIFLYNLPKLK
jgi:CRP-like cAMP-binding protein